MRFFRVQSQDLPRYLSFWDDQRRDRLSPKAAHSLKAMPAVGSPEAAAGRDDSDDRVEKTPSLINDVGQPFVVSVGEIALKRRRLDLVDGENGEQRRMTAQWLLVQTHHTAPNLLNGFCSFCGGAFWLFQPALCRLEALGAGLSSARASSSRCAFWHRRDFIVSAARL